MQIESCPRSKLFDLGVGWNLQAISEQFIWHPKSEWNDEIEHSKGAGLPAVQSTERSATRSHTISTVCPSIHDFTARKREEGTNVLKLLLTLFICAS